MPKRLALFLDGTWNTSDDNTNVWRLKALAETSPEQPCYYSVGVGTQRGERLRGGMFGYGLDAEVIRAYEWIVEQYRPEDRLFIFGFSRGAFTARSLAGFIAKCGLLRRGSPISLKQLYARYRLGATPHTIRELDNVPERQWTLEERLLKKYSMEVPVWFQGVWDTVGALGIPFGNLAHLSRSKFAFLETDLRINYSRAYHALAIDEHREAFCPTLWTKSVQEGSETRAPRTLTDVEQRWFVGAHADVGGGYSNGLLAQLPLKWIMEKAVSHGLVFDGEVIIDGGEAEATIHDSFAEMGWGAYKAAKFGRPFFRTMGKAPIVDGKTTTTTINETIDASVFQRWRRDGSYRPRNLTQWAEQHKINPGELKDSVVAYAPSTAAP